MKIHTVKVLIFGELEGVINFDSKSYELLVEKPYFSILTKLPIDFNYMSTRMRTAVMEERGIFHRIDYDILDTVRQGEKFSYDNHSKITFVVE